MIEEENLKLSSEGLNYISESFSSDEDPFLIIHWVEDGVMDALLEITGHQLIHLPERLYRPVPLFGKTLVFA